MNIQSGTFNLHNTEEVKLEGHYKIDTFKNDKDPEYLFDNWNIENQAPMIIGNVLFRSDTENINELIKIFMRYSYDPCTDLELDYSVKERKIMLGGTICPTRKVLFLYKNKVFIAFGRYIFGYNETFVIIKRGTDKIKLRDTDDEIYELESLIENDKVVLSSPKYDGDMDEYVYSFMIFDQETKILDAFGLYR